MMCIECISKRLEKRTDQVLVVKFKIWSKQITNLTYTDNIVSKVASNCDIQIKTYWLFKKTEKRNVQQKHY